MLARNKSILFIIFGLVTVFLFILNLWFGSVSISWQKVFFSLIGNENNVGINTIIISYRLPQAVTALATGIALGLSGLILQTLFRNPLAGPSVLGISSGASLGVAIAVLSSGVTGGFFAWSGTHNDFITIIFAFIGALLVLSVILYISHRIANVVTILIIGIMTGYAVSACVSILQFFSKSEDMYSFVMWGLGSFAKTNNFQASFLLFVVLAGFFVTLFYINPLNALLTGEIYARSIGFRIKRIRFILFFITGIFIAATTAYTGPIGFLGLAVPHIVRTIFKTSNHAILLPSVAIAGGALALLCNFIAKLPGFDISLPINAVTSIIGAPVVIWVLLRNRHIKQN